MKRISGLDGSTQGLADFHADPTTEKTWDGLGSYNAGAAKRELTDALTLKQHGLCAYCEINLIAHDTRVEHFVPQSDPTQGRLLACDYRNLLAVCMGGSNAAGFGPQTLKPDVSRFLPPARKNLSCDAAKENRPAADLLDPRLAPIAPSLMRVTIDGDMKTDSNACIEHGVPAAAVDAQIVHLGLDVGRLRNARQAVWAALEAAFQEFATLEASDRDAAISALAEERLLPDGNHLLPPFFTTARSFYGSLAEAILAQPPQAWI